MSNAPARLHHRGPVAAAVLVAVSTAVIHVHAESISMEPAQLSSVTPATIQNGWNTAPLVTVGEERSFGFDFNQVQFGYRPPGGLSEMAVWRDGATRTWVVISHALYADEGYPYPLSSGAHLTGARISYFDVNSVNFLLRSGGLLYTSAVDRAGAPVVDPDQVDEGSNEGGFTRFGAGFGVSAGEFGLANTMYLTGEQTADGLELFEAQPDLFFPATQPLGAGGQACVVDTTTRTLYVAPMLGRASFSGLCPVAINSLAIAPNPSRALEKCAVMIADDRPGAPLLLYIGQKGRAAAGPDLATPPFLAANGIGYGKLFVWVADDGSRDPDAFHGTAASRSGRFVSILHYHPNAAGIGGVTGWDAQGFASLWQQFLQAELRNAFRFARPADVDVSPFDRTQVALVTAGSGALFAGDTWGTTYLVDIDETAFAVELSRDDVDQILSFPASIRILYDGDDAGGRFYVGAFPGPGGEPDYGLRNPGTVDWGSDNRLYLGEERATEPLDRFGADSRIETSVWQLNPFPGGVNPPTLRRIAAVDRSALPYQQGDLDPATLGAWSPAGVLDVTNAFSVFPGVRLLMVSMRSLTLASYPGSGLAKEGLQFLDLVEGGQLLYLWK